MTETILSDVLFGYVLGTFMTLFALVLWLLTNRIRERRRQQ